MAEVKAERVVNTECWAWSGVSGDTFVPRVVTGPLTVHILDGTATLVGSLDGVHFDVLALVSGVPVQGLRGLHAIPARVAMLNVRDVKGVGAEKVTVLYREG
jgi:hypothetical protein